MASRLKIIGSLQEDGVLSVVILRVRRLASSLTAHPAAGHNALGLRFVVALATPDIASIRSLQR